MTADQPTPVVPTLRFPEFGNTPGWAPTKLNDLLDYEQPGKYIVEDSRYQDSGTPVLTPNKSFVLGHTAETDGIYDRVPVIIFDDFTTDAKYVDFPFKVKSSAIKILTCRRDVHLKLVYELMLRISFDPTQHKRHYISQYQDLDIPLPGKAEQQKIANCLGSLDDLIAAEGRKLEALRQHKQGLMQQLFPQPGATVPRLRFPEFRNAVEWRKKKLGDLSAVKASGDLDVAHFSSLRSTTHPYPVYSNAVENAGLYGYYSLPQYKKNSVTITARGTLGVALLRDQEFMGIGRLIVVSKLRNLDPCFLKECWNHLAVIPREVTSIPQLTAIAVRATVLPIPEPAEQKKIADCLGSLEDVLAAQARKLNTLEAHKQGLLQQLFPTLETE